MKIQKGAPATLHRSSRQSGFRTWTPKAETGAAC